MSSVQVIDTPLSGGALTTAALSGSAPRDWYRAAPSGRDAWIAHCRNVAPVSDGWLRALRPAFGSGAKLLDRVAAGGVVVTTGQQSGLFGGPWYTWHKAFSALEVAAALERETGVPVVPIFWAASDDADFAEAASTVIATGVGPELLSLRARAPDGVPMSHVTLGDEVEVLRSALTAHVGSLADHRPIDASGAFHAGATLGGAFVSMLRLLLEPLGIAVLDASDPSVGDAARPHLERALRDSRAVHDALVSRQNELVSAGYAVPVEVDRELSLVFAWEPGSDGLPRKRRMTLSEAEDRAGKGGRMSSNVLLRPVVERLLLPTVAYMAGPGEVAYFSQASAVAQRLDAPAPVVLPRWSGLLVPEEIAAALARLELDVRDLMNPHEAEGRLAEASLPPRAREALRALREAIDREVGAMSGLMPAAALEGARGQLAHRVDRFERRLLAAAKHRESSTMRVLAAARGVLFPFGKPQERALNGVPLWARHGDALIEALRSACAGHARRLVSGAAAPA